MGKTEEENLERCREAIFAGIQEYAPLEPGMRALEIRETGLEGDAPQGGGYDLIYSAMTLHHVADVPGMLGRIRTALRSGGLLAIADLVREDGCFHADNKGVAHFGFDPEEISAWVREAGLRVLHLEPVDTVEKTIAPADIRAYPVFLLVAAK